MTTAILWLRRDLRRHDLPALNAAHEAACKGTVLPLFVVDPQLISTAGPVRGQCLLEALRGARQAYEGALVLRHGDPAEVIPRLAEELGAGSVHISAEVHPYGRQRDERVRQALAGIASLVATGSPYAVEPGSVRKGDGDPFKVFTPFSRAWRDHGWRSPVVPPERVRWCRDVASEDLPRVESADGLSVPEPGEQAALERWQDFCESRLEAYADDRDRPDLTGTSQISMDLKYGTIHPRTLLADLVGRGDKGAESLINELCWREFYADVTYHRPESAWQDLRPELANMAYEDPAKGEAKRRFEAWCAGMTGFPVVDAGMRQLRREGWMHNRVRMITASFLAKDLHIWWPHGARHFLHWLRDGDVCSNNHGWQWVAGTGTDAAPYFRVFNPITQGERFDPAGDYVRRYVPELGHLTGKAVHQPWRAAAGYAHGYPPPIVDHDAERREALARYQAARDHR